MSPWPRVLLSLLTLVLLAGCERTVFRHAPTSAAAGCDSALVGRWESLAHRAEERGELTATIDADCRLVTVERKAEGASRTSAATTLHSGRLDGTRYLWVDAAWANASYEVERTPLDQDGDVYVFAWRRRGDTLELAAPPHKALAHKVLDDDIPGDVMEHEDSLTVRLTGDQEQLRKMLRTLRVYRFDEPLRFERAADAAR